MRIEACPLRKKVWLLLLLPMRRVRGQTPPIPPTDLVVWPKMYIGMPLPLLRLVPLSDGPACLKLRHDTLAKKTLQLTLTSHTPSDDDVGGREVGHDVARLQL
jgi:hypothetical protein